MNLEGTEFQVKVWRAIAKIPKGEVRTYKELARIIKKPKAIRAVANACGKNPYPIKIPCHRVVGSNGYLGGYSAKGGIKQKKSLLKQEGIQT
jgi:methylated-DNA-[protein]-cysteine S-methyltransferase